MASASMRLAVAPHTFAKGMIPSNSTSTCTTSSAPSYPSYHFHGLFMLALYFEAILIAYQVSMPHMASVA